jgi:hypothetical protein
MLLLLFFGDLFKVHNLGPDVFCNLLQFEFPEVGQFDLDLAPRHCDDSVHRLLDAFFDFHAFPHIDFEHGLITSVSCSDGRSII